ncbi:MAG TPA: HAMP domain-containing sensor histidine kinase [Planctomycetota bacterium]|nr:HAMP domain-containing sensor histidine kinase [Planctomycetota bacterium]
MTSLDRRPRFINTLTLVRLAIALSCALTVSGLFLTGAPSALIAHLTFLMLLIVIVFSSAGYIVSFRTGHVVRALLWVDILLQLGLLWYSGGIQNPLVLFLIVQFTAAWLLAPTREALLLTALGAGGLISLFFAPEIDPVFMGDPRHQPLWRIHYYQALALTLLVTATVVVYFVSGIFRRMRLKEQSLIETRDQLREQLETNEKIRTQVERLDRLKEVGELAAALAHELNTPLGTIHMLARELEQPADHPAPAGQDLEDIRMILHEANRCKTLTQQLLEISRLQPARLQEVDLREFVQSMIHLAAQRFPTVPIRLEAPANATANPPPLWNVAFSPVQQALLNVLHNACEAVQNIPNPRIDVRLLPNTTGVKIEIRDNGPGLSQDIQDRLFKPFATTKDSGMGLGLYISRKLLSLNNADLTLEPAPNGPGAVATIHLLAPLPAPSPAVAPHNLPVAAFHSPSSAAPASQSTKSAPAGREV